MVAASQGKDLMIRQSNRLIEAQYQLSLAEKRFLIYLMCQIGEVDEHFDWYAVDLPALAGVFPDSHRDAVSQFADVARSLRAKEVVVDDPVTGVVQRFNWLAADELDRRNRTVRVSIHPNLKEHLIQLKSVYTAYSLSNVSRLRSTYSFRLYELLKQVQKLRRRTFEPDRLRRMLGADDAYARYSNFKQRVLDPAVAEVNAHTDIFCEYRADKRGGKKVEALHFTITANARTMAADAAAKSAAAGELGLARAALARFNFSDAEADAILDEHAEGYVRENLAVVEERISQASEPVRQPKAYARKALEQDWRPKPAPGAAAPAGAEAREQARRARLEQERAEREASAAEATAKAEAWARYEALDEAGKATARDAFGRDLEAGKAGGVFVLKQWQASGLNEAGPRASFRIWLARNWPGEAA
ncbi:MAG: replication initiation protein [Elusimicrobia bacterium]|nr:replication initiation protein [Elusimicrobiota bacterium]